MSVYPVGSVVRWRSYFGEKVGTVVDLFGTSCYIAEPRPGGFTCGCVSAPLLVSAEDIIGLAEGETA